MNDQELVWVAAYHINIDGYKALFISRADAKKTKAPIISEKAADALKRIDHLPCMSLSSDDTANIEERIFAAEARSWWRLGRLHRAAA